MFLLSLKPKSAQRKAKNCRSRCQLMSRVVDHSKISPFFQCFSFTTKVAVHGKRMSSSVTITVNDVRQVMHLRMDDAQSSIAKQVRNQKKTFSFDNFCCDAIIERSMKCNCFYFRIEEWKKTTLFLANKKRNFESKKVHFSTHFFCLFLSATQRVNAPDTIASHAHAKALSLFNGKSERMNVRWLHEQIDWSGLWIAATNVVIDVRLYCRCHWRKKK